MLATAGVIIAAARIGERLGPFMASILITLPMNAGPGFFFIALQEPAPFITRGALFAFAATGLVLIFMAVFARLAQRFGFLLCLLIAAATWWLPMLLVIAMEPYLNLMLAFDVVLAGILLSQLLYRRVNLHRPPAVRTSWGFLLLRAAVAGLVVASVASVSRLIGPAWSGLLLGFPTIVAVSSWVMHQRYGGAFTAAVLTSGQRSLMTYAGFCLALYLLSGRLAPVSAVVIAFALACLTAMLLALWIWHTRLRGLTAPPAARSNAG
jgi:uncharacterized membrane protein (GlpM family)